MKKLKTDQMTTSEKVTGLGWDRKPSDMPFAKPAVLPSIGA
jgi:hypothetical protein